ncbi:MAG: hypothetical protein BGN88_08235 [Clostridiales bacterium 43-6]|nr:MAG: hypothetical protein BGN88_08235 [Clostridiales bacterium 43-6]
MDKILLSPPVAFLIFLLLAFGISAFTSRLAPKGTESQGKLESYGCGEDMGDHRVQPNYKQFFSFAFFFTIMHIIALLLTTIPYGIPPVAIVYALIAAFSIFILYKR